MLPNLNLSQIDFAKTEGKPLDKNIIKKLVCGHFKALLPISLSVLIFSYTFPTSYHKGIVLIDFLF